MALLPNEFSDLEPFAQKWCRATERERWTERVSSTIDEMQEFYDAILPRVEEALTYLDKFSIDDMPDDAVHLLQMVYSFVVVSFPVELWRQQYPPDTLGTSFDRYVEPLP